MNKAKILFVFIFLLSLFTSSQPVQADMAPPPAPQLGGLQPFQYQSTNVQMVYERVEMEIQPFISQDDHFLNDPVTVTAYFTMRNLGDKPESMQAIFPLESFTNCRMGYSSGSNSYTEYYVKEDSFSVMVNGNNVPVQKVVTDHPYADKNSNYSEACSKMSWAGFEVAFPVGEDVVVRVQYAMESGMVDYMQNIEYILETGAGWAGPIERGYVVVKFPYTATPENVLAESTPGYQFLYNEIFWSFENLEPTSENNIQVSIVSPEVWLQILTLRREVKENPKSPEKWLQLARIYEGISVWHGSNLRNSYYDEKITPTYMKGIDLNPDNASLYSNYAESVFSRCCYFRWDIASKADRDSIMDLTNKALSLDPADPIAHDMVNILESQNSNFIFTPPPTIPPTATSLFTATPSVTPSATITPIPSETPIVVTVIHTKLIKAPTATKDLDPALTIYPTLTPIPEESQKKSGPSFMLLGALIVFATGVGSGFLLTKRQKK
jgi:hypothetical protein